MDSLNKIVEGDLVGVEERLKELTRANVSIIPEISQYLMQAGGKRIRPMLYLLCSRLFDNISPKRQRLDVGASIELLHTATLLHDDIVDSAKIRRGKLAANAMFGNQASVLVGDYLLSKATLILVNIKNLRLLELFSGTANIMAEGEVAQLVSKKNAGLSKDEYFDIIWRKTASLMAASARSAAILAEATNEDEQVLYAFGKFIGFAFQIIDDALDMVADEKTFGKKPFKDLEEGKVTLPIIYALEASSNKERNFLESLLNGVNGSALNNHNMAIIQEILKNTKAVENTLQTAREYIDKALSSLSRFQDKPAARALEDLSRFILERKI